MEKHKVKIEIIQEDITKLNVDAIVNAANNSLYGGGGVDGSIHRAAGLKLKEECIKIRKTELPNGLPTGEAVITKGYNLPSKYVIHTVGPVYDIDEDASILLTNAYTNSLKIAGKYNLKTIAFPSISTGIFGYPIWEAIKIVKHVLDEFPFISLEKVVLCFFSREDRLVAEKEFRR